MSDEPKRLGDLFAERSADAEAWMRDHGGKAALKRKPGLSLAQLAELAPVDSPALQERIAAREAEIDREWNDLRNPSYEKRFAGIVGSAYAECRLDNYRTTGDERVVWSAMETAKADRIIEQLAAVGKDIRNAVENYGRGIVWYGKPGVGKDHLAAAMMWHAFRAGLSVKWINGTKFGLFVRDQLNFDTQQPAGLWLRQWTAPAVLTISDPDGESNKFSGDVREQLYNVIDARIRDRKPTWITINGSSESDLSSRLGLRIWDRLRQSAWLLHCNWPSGRKPRGSM